MPFYAAVDGSRVKATRDGPRRASCFECGAVMLAKTGEVVSWHWAHLTENPHCEAAREGEWHLAWKAEAAHEGVEIRSVDGKRRADVLTGYGYAVEFQKSALTGGDVQAREDDWKRKLVWIFYAREAYERPGGLEFWGAHESFGKVDWGTIVWPRAPERVKAARCWTLLDVGRDNLLFVGEWIPDSSPLRGYGWPVSRAWVQESIVNGSELPMRPGADVPIWAPSREKERKAREARWADRLERGPPKPMRTVVSPVDLFPQLPEQPWRAVHRPVGICRVCEGPVLSSSASSDCHPACQQWPDSGRRHGPVEVELQGG